MSTAPAPLSPAATVRLAVLRAHMDARAGVPGFSKNVEALRKEIARLEAGGAV